MSIIEYIEKSIKISPIESIEKNKYFTFRFSSYNGNKMKNLKEKMLTLTPEQRFGLILIISVKANIPCIIQGPTASGKSYLTKIFCEIFGQEPDIIVLNNDSGINLLTGQISPQSEKDIKILKKLKRL